MNKNSKIFVAGHRGLVGSALVRYLTAHQYHTILTQSHAELDLMNQDAVFSFFAQNQPEYVFLAAARVGGIYDNNMFPVEFIRNNLAIQWNVIEACFRFKVKRLLFLGSSCIYPIDCPRPIKESSFCSGYLEPTNQAYAIAKIAGIEHCWSYNRQYQTQFLCAMPTNLYGPNDNYDLEKSHVLPALIRKIHEAKCNAAPSVLLWGSGRPCREFLYVDDLAEACCYVMTLSDALVKHYFSSLERAPIINIGSGKEISIYELAQLISGIVGYTGELILDCSKPDGVMSKVMDVSLINELGWHSKTSLETGIKQAYQSFLQGILEKV